MKRTLIMLVLAAALAFGAIPAGAVTAQGEPAPLYRAQGEAVEGSYVVVMQPGRDATALAQHAGVSATGTFTHAFDGFSARLSDAQLAAVRRNPDVAYVEQDSVLRADHHHIQFNPPSWGLDRIDQRFLPLDNMYVWHAHARSVHAYVFDTGLDYQHPLFGGRAHFAYDTFGGNGFDCHGHGTHVGGTIGADDYGVSRTVQLWSVRVLNCNGTGTLAGIIQAIDWVIVNHNAPAVANFSLGGGFSQALNDAVDKLADAGVFTTVAAGNSGVDACTVSPASAPKAYTVAASTISDGTLYNHGPCIDVYAPGAGITSLWPGGGTATLNGTSMAAPHVAGVAVQFKGEFGDHSSQVVGRWITRVATPNVLNNVPPNTVNLLLYKPWQL